MLIDIIQLHKEEKIYRREMGLNFFLLITTEKLGYSLEGGRGGKLSIHSYGEFNRFFSLKTEIFQ